MCKNCTHWKDEGDRRFKLLGRCEWKAPCKLPRSMQVEGVPLFMYANEGVGCPQFKERAK